jgi:hypothetical protein
MTHESAAVVPSLEHVPGFGGLPRLAGRAARLLSKLCPLLAGLMLAIDCVQLLWNVLGDQALAAGAGDCCGPTLELLAAWLSRPATAQANARPTSASSAARCWFTLRASASWLLARVRLCALRDANLAGFQPK